MIVESSWDSRCWQRCYDGDVTVHLYRQSTKSGKDGCWPPCCRWQSMIIMQHVVLVARLCSCECIRGFFCWCAV